jgi:YD repeat-containing protein
MRLIATKNGKRWRCTRTIQASRKTTQERDQFGELVRAINADISATAKRKRATYEF